MKSLRVQVVVAATAVTIGLVTIAMLVLHPVVDQRLRDHFDALLVTHLREVAAACEYEHGKFHLRHWKGGDLQVAATSADGDLLAGAADLVQAGTPGTLAQPRLLDLDTRRVASASLVAHDDDHVHAQPVVLAVAMSTAGLTAERAQLLRVLVGMGVVLALISSAALAVALTRALRPVGRLAADIARLDPHRPGVRLGVAGVPTELAPLACRVDELCDRLEAVRGLASSIRGAAAHELRTPLAGLRATIEVARDVGGDPATALATCHGIVLQMQSRIDNLLMATRLDAGQLVTRREEVDAHGLLLDVWTGHAATIAERRLTMDLVREGAGLAQADAEALRMIVANLVDNAVHHSPRGATIRLECRDAGASLLVAVANLAPGLDPGAVGRLFAGGWRMRQDDAPRHAGLGLPICRELAGLMHGTLSADLRDGWLRIELRLPNAGMELEYW